VTGYDSENKVLYSVISKSSYFEEQDAGSICFVTLNGLKRASMLQGWESSVPVSRKKRLAEAISSQNDLKFLRNLKRLI